ncbi:tRNA threonylcarbamoyladenosine dehydratase [Candidatus Igneacidithiobacillus taiwanensis]|uniref:tRNA threonylcarbamoyladenosine dehydratase n=1 Tax=Candidatus Igneacidithiobacillus taiwanensis TaxID=1945924 RepID=UPI00289DAC87|nr:tRNA threonylcarbamoyladenosine dehydratase [Candidatus Igneacidithiobacillus taiwanensis]
MLDEALIRTQILLGDAGISRLAASHVFLAGLGGVGAYVAENLARAGVGRLTLVDHDCVGMSNLNRQLVALHSTLGRPKVEVMAERIADIAPNCQIDAQQVFLQADNVHALLAASGATVLADCIDAIACKAALIRAAQTLGMRIFSSMGAGNRLDPSQVRVARLNQTEGCPLARELRGLLRHAGASLDLWAVYSRERPRPPAPREAPDQGPGGRPKTVNGTISYMPALFGIHLAGAIVQHLLAEERQEPPSSATIEP